MGWTVVSPWKPVAGAGQNVTISATSTQSTAMPGTVNAVQLSAKGGNCHVEIGQDPTAEPTSMLVKSTDGPLVVKVAIGDKIAVIQDGTDTGTLNIAPLTY